MRILLSKEEKQKLLFLLKEKYSCKSMLELSKKMKISLKTLQNWFYVEARYIPENIVNQEILQKIKITERQEDNWGRKKGGKKAYKIIVKKYGLEEIRKRQSKGGKNAINKIRKFGEDTPFIIDINNDKFLEFYGVLLGDGWIGKYENNGKTNWLIGISGDKRYDKEHYNYLKINILELFNRNAYIKEKKNNNSMEINFSHKMLIKTINSELGFPIGKKIDLEISKEVYNLGYSKMKQVIRGIFDTDGSLYFDKTPVGKPYPCISITMKAPKLIKQVYDILIAEGFKV